MWTAAPCILQRMAASALRGRGGAQCPLLTPSSRWGSCPCRGKICIFHDSKNRRLHRLDELGIQAGNAPDTALAAHDLKSSPSDYTVSKAGDHNYLGLSVEDADAGGLCRSSVAPAPGACRGAGKERHGKALPGD